MYHRQAGRRKVSGSISGNRKPETNGWNNWKCSKRTDKDSRL
jgi:hypothetical protein